MVARFKPKLVKPEQLTEAPAVTDQEAAAAAPAEIGPEVEAKLVELAALNKLAYDQVREKAAKELRVRVATLDELVNERRPRVAGEALIAPVPVPWSDTVDGAALLEELAVQFRKHVVATDEATTANVLWLLFAHTHDCWAHSPALQVTAPTPDAGKTTALKFNRLLVPKPLAASNVSTAVVFRVISKIKPTFLIDEADAFFKDKPELRSVLDSGHDREFAYVVRCDGDDNEPKQFSTWCPKVIAGIGKMHRTLESRAIKIELRRKGRNETVEVLPRGTSPAFDRLRRQCVRWANDNAARLSEANPELPADLNNRATDNWRPLIAIADAAGGKWPKLARAAATKLTGETTDETYGIMLLADLRKLFAEEAKDDGKNLPTTEIINALAKMEDRPWPEFSKTGKPITAVGISRLLRPFKIFPRTVHLKYGGKASGYCPEWFADEFERYLPPDEKETQERQEPDPQLNGKGVSEEPRFRSAKLRMKSGLNQWKARRTT